MRSIAPSRPSTSHFLHFACFLGHFLWQCPTIALKALWLHFPVYFARNQVVLVVCVFLVKVFITAHCNSCFVHCVFTQNLPLMLGSGWTLARIVQPLQPATCSKWCSATLRWSKGDVRGRLLRCPSIPSSPSNHWGYPYHPQRVGALPTLDVGSSRQSHCNALSWSHSRSHIPSPLYKTICVYHLIHPCVYTSTYA